MFQFTQPDPLNIGAPFSAEDARRAVEELVTIIEVINIPLNSHIIANNILEVSSFCFQENFEGFNISEIIKAGSMGHGTAVPGHFDIDLVIYSRGEIDKRSCILCVQDRFMEFSGPGALLQI